jgi:hypothetical protein
MTNVKPFDFLIDCFIAPRRKKFSDEEKRVITKAPEDLFHLARLNEMENYHFCYFISILLIAELRCEERKLEEEEKEEADGSCLIDFHSFLASATGCLDEKRFFIIDYSLHDDLSR